MGRDDAREAVLARTEHVWPDVYQALKDGINTATELHDFIGWDYRDDTHLYKHMIRRTAVLAIKSLKPDLNPESEEDEPNLQMSGILLSLKEDVVKVWHSATVEILSPATRTRRSFLNQPPSRQTSLSDVRDVHDVHDILTRLRREQDRNKLILRWTVVEHCISRFDLVRPTGTWKGRVDVDWSDDLLKRYQLQ